MFDEPCPECGSKALYYNHSSTTLLATPPLETDDNGNIIHHSDPNNVTDYYTCKKCGKDFEVNT